MKKKLLFLLGGAFLGGLFSLNLSAQTNLISGWDGGTDTSSPSNFGWTSSENRTLQPRNNNGGIRMTTTYSGYKLEDGSNYSYSEGSEPSRVIFWLRYNTSGESFTYTFKGLKAETYYDFSALLGWHNNSNAPTLTVALSDGTNSLASLSKSVSTKTTMYEVSSRFKTPSTMDTDTDVKLTFTCNQTGDLMEAVSALSLIEVVVKDDLQTAISYATIADSYVSTDLTSAISTAQGVYDDAAATQSDVNSAETTLLAAVRAAVEADGPTTIVNPGFESSTVTTSNVAASGNAAPLDIAGGWSQTSSAAWSSSAVVAYGGAGQVNGANAPDNDNAGNAGNTLGISVGWGGLVAYQTAAVTYPAGVYTLNVNAYNAHTATQFASKFGFVPTTGDASLSTKTSFESDTWETDEVTFTLYKETEGRIQVGGQAVSDGSGANAKVFFDNVSVAYKTLATVWDEKKTAAQSTLADNTYETIIGAERTTLSNAINATPSTGEEFSAAFTALDDAVSAFNTTTVANYALLAAEKVKAAALGMASEVIADATPNTKTGLQALQDLKVAEYLFVSTNYAYGVDLGAWTTEGYTADNSGQHWDGTNASQYKEQENKWGDDPRGYAASSWNIKFYQSLELPAGKYVFKVAGRKASGVHTIMSLDVTKTSDDSSLGSVNDFPEGDTGLGINTAGATDYTIGEGHNYANSGNGRGWEWRYVKFELTTKTEVKIAVNASADAASQWMSFCNYTLQTDNEANISLIAYNVAYNSAVTVINDANYNSVVGTERANLQSAIDADASLDKTNKDAIDAATTALTDATTAFTAAKASYEALAVAKTFFDDAEYTQALYPYATDAKFAAIATAKAMSEANAAECDAKASAIYAAYRGFVESNALAENVATAVDCTSVIENANAQQGDENAVTPGQAFGWTKGTGIGRKSDQSFTDANGNSGSNYFDYWAGTAWTKTITQNIIIPAGRYVLSVTSRGSNTLTKYDLIAGDNTASMKRINSDVNTGTFGRGWNDNYLVFNHAGGTVSIGIDAEGGDGAWMSFDRFRLVRIEEAATMVITDAKYATFIAPFDVTIPSGVTAKKIMGESSNVLTEEAVETTIPANTPVVLYSETAVNETFYGESVAATNELTEGILTGTYTEIAAPEKSYILNKIDDWVGFAKVAEGNTTLKVGANRCYIKADAVTPAPFFRLGGTTNIANVENAEADAAVYDLMGRRVDAPAKGIYIVNGKKVLVK